MSLAGIAISIGVLVDSSVVMAENVMHRLREQFGSRNGSRRRARRRLAGVPGGGAADRLFGGDHGAVVSARFRPGRDRGEDVPPAGLYQDVRTGAVAVLAITLVPALCTIFIRGQLRSEQENPLIRGVIEVYRPVLSYLMDRPAALAWVLGVTFLLGFVPLGSRPVMLAILFLAMVSTALLARRRAWAVVLPASLLIVALVADQTMTPLAREFMTPLDEGMVMDMPITVPRASVTESVDDLKARDMVLCRFPEVDMVVGKAGRAETPTDPAPMDMIETMVNFRPRELWPRRKLGLTDAKRQGRAVYDALVGRGVIGQPDTAAARDELIEQSVAAALVLFDAASREYAYHRYQEMLRETAGISPSSMNPSAPEEARVRHALAAPRRGGRRRAARAGRALNSRDWCWSKSSTAARSSNPDVAAYRKEAAQVRAQRRGRCDATTCRRRRAAIITSSNVPIGLDPAARAAADPGRDPGRRYSKRFSRRLLLWKVGSQTSWRRSAASSTWPCRCRAGPTSGRCRSRIESTCFPPGVNTPIGIRVLGRNLDDVIRGSEEVARVVKPLRGAVDVVADPDSGQAVYRDPHRSRARRRARCERRRGQRRDRDGARGQGGQQRRSKGANGIPIVVGTAAAGATTKSRYETSR